MDVANELMVRGIVVGVFQENAWIIGSRRTREAVAVDPGDEPEAILDLAKDLGVTIKLIVCSHAHVDHIMGVRGVKEATGAPFLLHGQDRPLMERGWQSAARWMGMEVSPPPPDGFVQDGDVVEVEGVRLQVIHTPGHTPGSISLYTPGMLFSGDTLFRGSIGRTDLPGGDYQQIMQSITERLLQLPEETVVLPGHMQETTIRAERQTNPFVLMELQRRRGS